MGKILIITNDLEIGGIQKSLIQFLKYLVKKGFEVDLMVWEGGVLRAEIPKAVQLIEMNYAKTWKEIIAEPKFFKKLTFLSEFVRFIFFSRFRKKPWFFYRKLRGNYHVAVSYTQNGFPPFYSIDRVSADRKLLWYHHGSYTCTEFQYNLEQKYFRKFAKIVTVSCANKNMLERHFLDCANNIIVVPNIIDVEGIFDLATQKVSDFNVSDEVFSLVTVSRFSKEKGIDLAIKIADKLSKKGLRFKWYFIGDGETFGEIKKQVADHNLESFCLLLGNKINPYPYIKLADFYVQTSYVESQSITIYEALVLDKLIVTSDLPALREALQDGKLGILCKPEVDDFVERINNLIVDKTAQKKLSKSVQEYVVTNDFAYQEIKELLK